MGSKIVLVRTLVAASSAKTAGVFSARFCTEVARPKRFELLTPRFVVWCSIQLSYGRVFTRRSGLTARLHPIKVRAVAKERFS